ncbi:MAG: hypothetical protein J6R40_00175 [Clostridia bacterium]|nr:hypothetical protein [Clostridia bacterium]
MQNLINEIAAALKILGISGRITLHPIVDLGRVEVAVNGKYFGVWDSVKKTFVD